MRVSRVIVSIAVAVGLVTSMSVTAEAAFRGHGTAAATNQFDQSWGSLPGGQDVSALSTCHFASGRRITALAGDTSTYKNPDSSTRSIGRLSLLDFNQHGKLLWTSGAINGWVQAVRCVVSGNHARLYIGGSFTRINGSARSHTAALDLTVSASSLSVRLSSWQVAVPCPVNITYLKGKIFIGGCGGLTVANARGAKLWQLQSNCNVMVSQPIGNRVYIGGSFTMVRGPGQAWFRHYGLVQVSINGKVNRKFKPRLARNAKLCDDPTATGHQTYSGNIPLSMTPSGCGRSGVIVGMGGMYNRLALISPKGKYRWSRRMDGDIQTVSRIGCQVFAGWHLSHPPRRIHGYDAGFFRVKGGAQLDWPLANQFRGGGSNADGRNNGVIASEVVGSRLCLGGGFTSPAVRYGCIPLR